MDELEKIIDDYKKACENGYIEVPIKDLYNINKFIKNLTFKIVKIEKYANWHIEHLNEDIADYIDDKADKSIIDNLREQREHFVDFKRILNNEKTYLDYREYLENIRILEEK